MIDGLNNGLPGVPSPSSFDAPTRAIMPPDVLQRQDEAACLRAAEALEAPRLSVIAFRGTMVSLEQMAEAVGGIGRRAQARGVSIVLEFMPGSGIPDLGYARQLRDAAGAPTCGILLDLFHLDRSGGTAADIARLDPGTVAAIQLSDRRRGQTDVPFGGRLLPGRGDLPLDELVTVALSNNPSATLDLEVLNAELQSLSAEEAARKLAAATGDWRLSFTGSQ